VISLNSGLMDAVGRETSDTGTGVMVLAAGASGEVAGAGSNFMIQATAAGATMTVGAATATAPTATAMATATAASAIRVSDAMQVEKSADAMVGSSPVTNTAWDALLDVPKADPMLTEMMITVRRAANGLTTDQVISFINKCEFISLGCFCAPSYSLQLLGLKKNSFPFDWVRSSLDGIIHCLQAQFQDFLTYSTYQVLDQYAVFGGTRWGGSFWHHNLEAPSSREDMLRRARRFYGYDNVPAEKPRFFVRVVNSTKEILAAVRLRDELLRSVPEVSELYLLLILELQAERGGVVVADQEGLLVYCFLEEEMRQDTSTLMPGAHPLSGSGARYATAIAFGCRYWAGDSKAAQEVRTFASFAELDTSIEQWDGGDPSRELFAPRRFFGQQLEVFPEGSPRKMQRLVARTQMQVFSIPATFNVALPLSVQCFGKSLEVKLPGSACPGHLVHLYFHEGALSATLSMFVGAQMMFIEHLPVKEVLAISQ